MNYETLQNTIEILEQHGEKLIIDLPAWALCRVASAYYDVCDCTNHEYSDEIVNKSCLELLCTIASLLQEALC